MRVAALLLAGGLGMAVPAGVAAQPAADEFWQRDTLSGDWGGLRPALAAAGVQIGLLEQSELWQNLTGGLRQGFAYDGLTTGSVRLDLDLLAGWSGASLFASAYQIHGRGPSATLVGNLQVVSNIEATADTKLYALWLEQILLDGLVVVRIGQEGANDQMMVTQYGAVLLNSSFGYPGLAAADLPSGGPNYPMASPFVRVQVQASAQITLVGAAFNADPAPPGAGDAQQRDKGGLAFRLNDHVLSFGELWYAVNQEEGAAGLAGTYKLGFWYYSGHLNTQLPTRIGAMPPASSAAGNGRASGLAVYGIVDQLLWKPPGGGQRGIGAFAQVMAAPDGIGLSNLFVEAGLNWTGPFAARPADILALGVAYLGINPTAHRVGNNLIHDLGAGAPFRSNETVVEASWLFQLTPWWAVQPDVQVVINPGAGIPSNYSLRPLKNDVIAGLRASVTF